MSEENTTVPPDIAQQLEDFAAEARKKYLSSGCSGWSLVGLLILGLIVVLGIWLLSDLGVRLSIRPEIGTTARPSISVPNTFVLLGIYQNDIYYLSLSEEKILRYNSGAQSGDIVDTLSSYEAFFWSPQRDKIVFISTKDEELGNLYILDLGQPEAKLKRITQRGEEGLPKGFGLLADSPLAWSEDGTAIAFVAYRGDEAALFVVQADGSRTQRLTHDGAPITSITWTENDSRIAYVSFQDGREKLYIIDRDGGNREEWKWK